MDMVPLKIVIMSKVNTRNNFYVKEADREKEHKVMNSLSVSSTEGGRKAHVPVTNIPSSQ